jgi:hypothetical protein
LKENIETELQVAVEGVEDWSPEAAQRYVELRLTQVKSEKPVQKRTK